MTIKLFPYQEDCLNAIVTHPNKRQLITAPTGVGKTILFLSAVKKLDLKTLIIRHRNELILQTREKAFKVGILPEHLGEFSSFRKDLGPKIIIASIQTATKHIDKLKEAKFEAMVVDECLVSGTIIGECGQKIEEIKVGDQVISYNEKTKCFEYKEVKRLFRNKAKSLIKITTKIGSIVCTPNHPFMTNDGWKHAIDCNDIMVYNTIHDLHSLPKAHFKPIQLSEEKIPESWAHLLFKRMLSYLLPKSFFRDNGKNKPEICKRPDEEKESDEQSCYSSEGIYNPSSNGMEADCSRWKWENASNNTNDDSFSSRMGNGTRCLHENETTLSPLLQNRCSLSNIKSGDRSGWEFSFQSERRGSTENRFLNFVRVDHIEVLEQTSDGTFGGLCPDGFVYNFEVEGNQSYIANNFIAHNCHHAGSDSYQELINKLGFYDESKYLLGFTATPIRGDHISLADTFPSISWSLSLEDAIRNGYISDIRGVRIAMNAELSGIKKSQGDYTIRDLEKEMNTLDKNKIISKTFLERAHDKKAIAFCCTVKHARDLTLELLSHEGIRPGLITGDMSMDEREITYNLFREGSLNVLCSCMVLTEGFDVPDVDCILMTRPTTSPGLYRQMIGRGLRKHPGKKECLVLEFTSNDRRMLTLEDISPDKRIRTIRENLTVGEAIKAEEDEEAAKIARNARVYNVEVEVYDPLDRANKPVFASIDLGEGYFFIPHFSGFFYGQPSFEEPGAPMEFYVIEFSKSEKYYVQDKSFNESYLSYSDALDNIQREMKKRKIRKFYPLDTEEITDKQYEILSKFTIPCEDISRREASKRLERLFITKFLNRNYGTKFKHFE